MCVASPRIAQVDPGDEPLPEVVLSQRQRKGVHSCLCKPTATQRRNQVCVCQKVMIIIVLCMHKISSLHIIECMRSGVPS
jgi:hypothetical protein